MEESERVGPMSMLIGRSHCSSERPGMASEGEGEVFGGAQLSRGASGRGACYWIKSRDSVEVEVKSDTAGIWV